MTRIPFFGGAVEINKAEVAAVKEIASNSMEEGVVELMDLQLTLIGGGCGEVLFG